MKKLILPRKEIEYKEFVKRSAFENDFKTLIKEPTLVYDEKEPDEVKIIYDVLDIDTKEVVNALKKINYHKSKRTNGLNTRSRIFGFRPRHTFKSNYCSSTSLAVEAPDEHAVVCNLATKIEDYYMKYYPQGYKRHLQTTDEKIKADWRIGGKSAFTSGIINKNNPLNYHFDTGNFNNVYSMMIVFKENVAGGYLSIPEYDIGIELVNNSILLFDGQSIMHGVTPIKYLADNGYRFSIVYYSLKKIWECLEINEELAWTRKHKTEREINRANMSQEHREKLLKAKQNIIKRRVS